MLHFFLALMAAGLNTGADPQVAEVDPPAIAAPETTQTVPSEETQEDIAEAPAAPAPTTSPSVSIGSGVVIGEGTLLAGVPDTPAAPAAPAVPAAPAIAAVPGMDMSVVPPGLTAEPQTPSGKFTTAAEIRPIMDATKPAWVSLREFDGNDLLYVSSIWTWRCGLAAMAISLNNEPMQNWPLPDCHMQYASPNAILEEDGLPFLKLRLGSVQSITIQLVYDDLSMDSMTYQRRDVLAP